ncbi:metallophosphoesterase family protein [Paenibacillus sp. Z6-24]
MTEQQRIAVIADVHSNILALDAVLRDIDRQGIRHIYNLGDSVYGPMEPAQTAQRLIERGIVSIRGNQDRVMLEPRQSSPHSTFDDVLEDLQPAHMEWLMGLPEHMVIGEEIYACHGTPQADDVPLLENITAAGVHMRSDEQLMEMLQSIGQNIIVCAHTHVPCTRYLPDGRLILNPGSVGLPAYEDDLPYPHVMESHTPHARYATLEKDQGQWKITHHLVPYDWESAARQAEQRQRPDWAVALRTGRTLPF